jgi:hypothetical protein
VLESFTVERVAKTGKMYPATYLPKKLAAVISSINRDSAPFESNGAGIRADWRY